MECKMEPKAIRMTIENSTERKGTIETDDYFIKFVRNPSQQERFVYESTFRTFSEASIPFKTPKLLEYNYFQETEKTDVIYLLYERILGEPIMQTSYYVRSDYTSLVLDELDRFRRQFPPKATARGYGNIREKFIRWTDGDFPLSSELFDEVDKYKRTFYRDLNPSNVLVDDDGHTIHVDLMNNDTNPSAVDIWYYLGFLPPWSFERQRELSESMVQPDELALVGLLETLKFFGHFRRHTQILLRNAYRDMVENCASMIYEFPRLRRYRCYLDSIASQENEPVRLDKIVRDSILLHGVNGAPIYHTDRGNMTAVDRRTAEIIGGCILPHLLKNAKEAAGFHGRVKTSVSVGPRGKVIEISDNGNGIASPETFIGYGYSTKGPNRGRGLFFANLYTRSLGGTLELESSPGDGFVARVLLPEKITINDEIMRYIEQFI